VRFVADHAKTQTALTPLALVEGPESQGSSDDATASTRSGRRRPSPKHSRITLILADAGPMFRLGLRALLSEYQEFEIEEAGDLETLVVLVGRARPPATALIDLDLPPAGGLAAVARVCDSGAAPVVWCSGSRLTPDVVFELVRGGAVGILRKEIAPNGIVRTLRAAANGEATLPRDLVTGLLARIHSLNAPSKNRSAIETLSDREREVLALVAAGDSNKAIARKLVISEFTAKRHVQNVLNKLAVHRRQDAASRFREELAAGLTVSLPVEGEQS
jgi:DNA-binding NarL/FixJ family response regulator